MSKQESITRFNLIIKRLRKSPASLKEIQEYLAQESELQDSHLDRSNRTFGRELDEIRASYNIDIVNDRSLRAYRIDSDGQPRVTERVMEALDIINALNISQTTAQYIHFDNRRARGTENLHGLIHAIKNTQMVEFTHQKFWENFSTHRRVDPLALKEFQNRWYVLAKDYKDHKIKTFALDRITDLVITNSLFSRPVDFDVADYFRNCFGIVCPDEGDVLQDVVLSFDAVQGKYVRSLPLHESQEILADVNDELRVKLRVYITHDFVMEILSYGNKVEVIEPESFRKEIKEELEGAWRQYC